MRIQGLSPVDPLSVPLPNGTEVTTRVDRAFGDRVIPQGAVGRVVGSEGRQVLVRVLGVGELRYARDELRPRRAGQVAYARRRAASWEALAPCVVLETTVGSRAWGLADEGSDVDRRGVFVPPFPWTTGLVPAPEDLVSLDASTTCWAAAKTVRQALRADPNTLELLFVPGAEVHDVLGGWLLAERDAFVSAEIYGSFGRYALSQLRKLGQSQRLAEHRGVILDWLRDEPSLTLDAVAARLVEREIASGPTARDAQLRAKEYVKQLTRSLHDQAVLPNADFAALRAFAASQAETGFELPRELRPKNAYNLLRLMHTALRWLETGTPVFAFEGPLRERLRAIKAGRVPLDEVLAEAEALTPALEAARHCTPLPPRPDLARADAVLRRIAEEAARRWIGREPGPFGAGAPPPPVPAFEDDAGGESSDE